MWQAIVTADKALGTSERLNPQWLDIVADELPGDAGDWQPENDVIYDEESVYGLLSAHDRERLRSLLEAGLAEEQALKALPHAELDGLYNLTLESGRGFNTSEVVPDYAFWTNREAWTVDEAVSLSLGRDPKLVSWSELKILTSKSDFAAQYAQRRDEVLRAIKAKKPGLHPFIDPTMFIKWAVVRNLDLPAELHQPSNKGKSAGKRRYKIKSIDRTFHHHTRDTLYRLLLGLAQKNGLALPYKEGDKSNAFTSIAHGLPHEFRIGPQTLRRLVREASKWGVKRGLIKTPSQKAAQKGSVR
jgi:hypothetical protein